MGRRKAIVINISTSGTLVNGKTIAEHVLKPGDVIRTGSTDLRFQLGAAAEAPTVRRRRRPGRPRRRASPSDKRCRTTPSRASSPAAPRAPSSSRDTNDDKVVAFKVLQPEFSRNEEEMQRFIRAMKTMLPLRHPNLVALYGAGKTGLYCWVAMEYVDGESMTQVIQRLGVAGMLDWRYGYRVAVHIARALEYAHGQAILHRNVTPQTSSSDGRQDGEARRPDAGQGPGGHAAQQITRPANWSATWATCRRSGRAAAATSTAGPTCTAWARRSTPSSRAGRRSRATRCRSDYAHPRPEPDEPQKYQMAVPAAFQGIVLKLLAKRPEDRFQTATTCSPTSTASASSPGPPPEQGTGNREQGTEKKKKTRRGAE